jgi:hypothetical protein
MMQPDAVVTVVRHGDQVPLPWIVFVYETEGGADRAEVASFKSRTQAYVFARILRETLQSANVE